MDAIITFIIMLLKVVKVSDETQNGNFIHTLEGNVTRKVFGIEKKSLVKFCMALPEEVEVGTEQNVELAGFRQETFTSTYTDDEGNEREGRVTWLFNDSRNEQ